MFDYQSQVERVTDGDTVRFLLDQGMYNRTAQAIRLTGVHSPELNEPNGKECRQFVIDWLQEHSGSHDSLAPLKWPFLVRTAKDKQTFNRYIGKVSCLSCEASLNDSINAWLTEDPTVGQSVEMDVVLSNDIQTP